MAEEPGTGPAPQEQKTVTFKLFLDCAIINIQYKDKHDLFESLKKKLDGLGIPITSVYSTDINKKPLQLKDADAVALAAGSNRKPLFAHIQDDDAECPDGHDLPLWQRHGHGRHSHRRHSSTSHSSRSHEHSPEPFPHRPGDHDYPNSHHHHHPCHPRGPPPPPTPPSYFRCFCGAFGPHQMGFGCRSIPLRCFCGAFGPHGMGFGCRPIPFHDRGFGHGYGRGFRHGQGCKQGYSHGVPCSACEPKHQCPAFGRNSLHHCPGCGGHGFHGC
uniref:Glutaredoxin domain-containing protein n=1 Tax=Haemonchus contortus TaxID=6289 RepID=A0A7I4XYY6_HAECO